MKTNLINKQTFLNYSGYDLAADGRLNQGDYASIDDAINQFLNEVTTHIYSLIKKNRGAIWTNNFFKDMQEEIDENTKAYEMQQTLIECLHMQCVFEYENGYVKASSEKNDKNAYSEDMIDLLYSSNILLW